MTSNTDLIINLQRPNVATVAYAVQGDSLSRVLHLTLMDGDTPWTPPEGALAIIRYYKPDGTRGFYDTLEDGSAAISISGNVATVTLAAQALAVEGTVKIQLNFYTAAKVTLSSFCWRLEVEAQVASDADIESSDYYSALTETIAKAIELLPTIEQAGEYAEAAELARDAAAASAAAALASQNAAAGSATAAGVAAQSASASQQAASVSATAAGQAATSADASKTAAAGSATDAAQSEAAAEGSAEDAEAWAVGQRNGEDVSTTDPTHNNNAKYWAEQAKTAAGGGVLSVNGKSPDDAGNVILTAADLGAVAVVNNSGAHNAIYRGKNLGTSVTAEQYAATADGSFADLYIGDYWTIGGVLYRIAAFDYYLRCGEQDLTTHHVVIVPDSNLYYAKMNAANTTEGGYVGSAMYKTGLKQAKTTIKAAFNGHVLKHRVYLTNAVTNGKPSAGLWCDSEVELMNEQMVYGGAIFMPGCDGTTVPTNYRLEKSQLPLFAHRPDLISNRLTFWLRDVVTASGFARVNDDGNASCTNAGDSSGVRPAFCVYGGD